MSDDTCLHPDAKGTTSYNKGCRCGRCREAWRLYQTDLRRRRREGEPKRVRRGSRPSAPLPPPIEERPCEECSVVFLPLRRHARFCSRECMRRVQERRRRRPKRAPRGRKETRVCRWCAQPFVVRASLSTKTCSAPCAAASRWIGKSCPFPRPERKRPDGPPNHCSFCDREIPRGRKWCRTLCYDLAAGRMPLLYAVGYGSCRDCGKTFVRRSGDVGAFCSMECGRRARKRTRKHTLRTNGPADRFTLREIAERDGWRCHICRKRVGKSYHPNHQRAGSIDHLIPVSEGGTHTLDNVALAHRICNSIRGAQGLAQTRLAV